ncbi:hypothetical protein DPMN_172797, partial [Dreissena polymorpha]
MFSPYIKSTICGIHCCWGTPRFRSVLELPFCNSFTIVCCHLVLTSDNHERYLSPTCPTCCEKSRGNAYCSRDYNDQASNELSMEPLSLDELKSEKCPRRTCWNWVTTL